MDRNCFSFYAQYRHLASLSARRAWIEIEEQIEQEIAPESLSARRAWIEILPSTHCSSRTASLSARRAWIEIPLIAGFPGVLGVALRKESVDRNSTYVTRLPRAQVALRKESVDRNDKFQIAVQFDTLSLSARRAWIEIEKS